jgi:hypothetical protein
MSFNWNDFHTLAQKLAQDADDASKRTAVSRAYYSAFHDAMDRAVQNCGAKQGGNSHEWCWDRYIYSGDNTCNKIGLDGKRLKAKRVKVDYEAAEIPRLDEYVSRALADARRLKDQISVLDDRYPKP